MSTRICIPARNLVCAAGQSLLQSCVAWVVAGSVSFVGVTHAAANLTCRPSLVIKDGQLSEMLKPTLERKWTAVVSVDASRCATTAGYFEVGFSRLKENSIDLDFREQFAWSSPKVTIGVDFWADEAVESYWIDSIQECPCAR